MFSYFFITPGLLFEYVVISVYNVFNPKSGLDIKTYNAQKMVCIAILIYIYLYIALG